jgi:hypothetical protein
LRCVEDERLSWRAKAVHLYLYSRPGDWVLRREDIVRRSTDGKYAVSEALKELRQAGYIVIRTRHGKRGRIEGTDWYVYGQPQTVEQSQSAPRPDNQDAEQIAGNSQSAPCPDLPGAVEPEAGKSAVYKTINNNLKHNNTPTATRPVVEGEADPDTMSKITELGLSSLAKSYPAADILIGAELATKTTNVRNLPGLVRTLLDKGAVAAEKEARAAKAAREAEERAAQEAKRHEEQARKSLEQAAAEAWTGLNDHEQALWAERAKADLPAGVPILADRIGQSLYICKYIENHTNNHNKEVSHER